MKYLAVFILTPFIIMSTWAQDGDWFKNIEVKAFTSTSYGYNFNNPESQTNDLRIFDTDANSIKLDVFELSLMKETSGKGSAGMRVDFIAGGSIPRVIHSAGMFQGEDVDLKQAYVSYVAPVGNGLQLDFGKFVTHIGYEVIEGNDGYNDNVTRSFCFGWTIPFTHTGLRASYGFSDQVSAMLMVVNGWDNSVDNNKSKSIGAQVAVTPFDDLSLYANAIYGPEDDANNSDNTTVVNVVGNYAITSALSLGANLVMGMLDNGVENVETQKTSDAGWMGISGYLRYDFTDWFSLALRGEQFDDEDGVRTDDVQKLTSITLTPEFRAENFVFRFDVRMDSSDEKVFHQEYDNPEEMKTDSQTTLTLNMLYILP